MANCPATAPLAAKSKPVKTGSEFDSRIRSHDPGTIAPSGRRDTPRTPESYSHFHNRNSWKDCWIFVMRCAEGKVRTVSGFSGQLFFLFFRYSLIGFRYIRPSLLRPVISLSACSIGGLHYPGQSNKEHVHRSLRELPLHFLQKLRC